MGKILFLTTVESTYPLDRYCKLVKMEITWVSQYDVTSPAACSRFDRCGAGGKLQLYSHFVSSSLAYCPVMS